MSPTHRRARPADGWDSTAPHVDSELRMPPYPSGSTLMRAAWYDRTGPAEEVLEVGELPAPEPGPGQVRVQLAHSGITPSDAERRAGSGPHSIRFQRVIPGDDGAGTIDRVGPGVPTSRIGRRVWVHSASHSSRFGTCAEYVVLPDNQATDLPEGVPTEVGACLGAPALTAHRSLFADGPIAGLTVLVTGSGRPVAHYTIQMAKHAGALVIATADTPEQRSAALTAGADLVVDQGHEDTVERILDRAPLGIDRVVDIALDLNLPLTSRVVGPGATIAGYSATAATGPILPFRTLLHSGVTIRAVMLHTMPTFARDRATADVTTLLERQILTHPIAAIYQIDQIRQAHLDVESGQPIGNILIAHN
ncbi:NADPH:quinone reductase [Nocardia tengchongensis]|uniref:NADPH:quinone reductase n=1 Tax=Nocardia tengchongensis TaxID=2055889 RepID=UPI0036A6C313